MNKLNACCWLALLAGIGVGTGAAHADEAAASGWHQTIDISTQYYAWESDIGWPPNAPTTSKGGGDQLFVPFGYQIATD